MKVHKLKSGTELPIMQLKGKDYLIVAHRLVWFREECPTWSIQTELKVLTDKLCVAMATIRNDKGEVVATAHKSETPQGFADFIEKAETGSIGRALAYCGFGTQFCEPDLDEGERIVDAPLASKQSQKPSPAKMTSFAPKPAPQKPVQQSNGYPDEWDQTK